MSAREVYDNPAYSGSKTDLGNGHRQPVTVGTLDTAEKDTPSTPSTSDQLEQQARRDREPLRFCKWITERPKLWFGIFLGCHIFFVLVTMILAKSGYDIIPIVFDKLPLDIRKNRDFLRGVAFDNRDYTDTNLFDWLSGDTEYQPERSEKYDAVELLYYYPNKDGNVFTKANLQAMNETEYKFFNEPDFKTKYCYLVNGICEKPLSIMRFFDGTYSWVDPDFYDPEFNHIVNVLFKASYYNETKLDLTYHLGKDASITDIKVTCYATRSLMSVGYPLKGFNSTRDRSDEQKKKLEDYYKTKLMPDIGDPIYKNGVGDMDFVYSSGFIIGISILKQVIKDFMLIALSIAFIVTFMCIQTQSLWIALFSFMTILTGFCCANLIYRCILQFRYFGVFHILSVFIILGIGADDVFVYVDTWKETSHHKYKSLSHRVSDCFRKASLAMLFTSLTTAIAFFVSATSPFLGVYSFGVFSGILVLVNYCSVVTLLPCAVILHHLHFEKFRCCCCCPRDTSINDTGSPSKNQPRQNCIVRFFKGPYFRFITHKVARWIIILVHTIVVAVMIYFCTQLKVNEEQIKFMKDGTRTGKYFNKRSELYPSRRQENLKVFLVWGLKEQDLSDCHHSNASCTGKTVWDDSFSLDTVQAQDALLDLCDKIRDLDDDTISKLRISRSKIDNKPNINCFLQDMKRFYDNGTWGHFPANSSSAYEIMNNNRPVYQTLPSANVISSTAFETSLSYFMYNRFDYSELYTYLVKYKDRVGEARTQDTQAVILGGSQFQFNYYYGTRLRYASISIDTDIDGANLGFPQGLPLRDEWEEWTQAQMAKLPNSLKNGFQTTPSYSQGFILWHWLAVQEVLVSSAVTGIAVGIAVALPILVIATMNLITGLLATLIILLITVCVVGIIPAAGWKLGLMESLNLVLVVGLAVDYVVHLAEAYSHAPYPDRLRRCQVMLEELGISVLSGAITTIGSSVFLLFAQIIFFSQFGIFILATIGFSIFHALSLFATLMAMIGPEGSTGSLTSCCKSSPRDVTSP